MNKKKRNANIKHRKNKERIRLLRLASLSKAKKKVINKLKTNG